MNLICASVHSSATFAIGIHRKVKFQFCACYNDTSTLIKLGFFPATPKRPEVAFQFQLLDLLEALLLECQVAIKDFTNALECLTKCPLLVGDLYSYL